MLALKKMQRRNLNPAFTFRHVKELYPVFWNTSVQMVRLIEETINNNLQKNNDQNREEEKGGGHSNNNNSNIINIADWSNRATLDIIGSTQMDRDFGSLHDPNNRLVKEYKKIFSDPPRWAQILQLLLSTLAPKLIPHLPFKRDRELREGREYITAVSRGMVQEKKQQHKNNGDRSADILSVAIESGVFTDESLVDHLMTFLVAGHETTATALQWTAYILCKRPDIQKRLREEIRANLPSISDPAAPQITANQVDSLPYLSAVCSESLRFYPPVPTTMREAARDTRILDTFVPKGTTIILAPTATNLDPQLWGPDADTFNPERWMGPGRAKSGGAESNYAFLTFLHGPRSCIGASFAKSELLCLVATLVGRFEMELVDPNFEPEPRQGITMPPKGGVEMRIKVLEGW
ncbi:hypothetical protein AJ80_09328 [Polytolypa hystricis UAMH7299]|uniref:Cytochrome P450 monooxygenase n=1 Tax=Polytolypa hystricis (strain UAMH7299) TaxID=1447883 RepID=A0A2B7WSV6_POLH7|nr:hypothetical protein AJ80_09328 [Polytolypa hystricis UAMH7299]